MLVVLPRAAEHLGGPCLLPGHGGNRLLSPHRGEQGKAKLGGVQVWGLAVPWQSPVTASPHLSITLVQWPKMRLCLPEVTPGAGAASAAHLPRSDAGFELPAGSWGCDHQASGGPAATGSSGSPRKGPSCPFGP